MKAKLFFISAFVAFSGLASTFMAATITSQTASACDGRLLTMPAWYNGLTDSECNIKSPAEAGGLSPFIWKIVANIVEMLMHLTGYLAVGFMIYGGFVMMTAGGSDGAVRGRKILLNSAIGLVISITAIILVNFVAGLIVR